MRVYVKLVAAVVLLAALVQGVLWYAASRWFAQLAQAAAPVAELTYRSSFAWPNGKAGVNDLRLRPHALPGEEIGAESLTFDLGGPMPLLGMLFSRADTTPPEQFGLHLRRMRLSLGLERMARDQSTRLGYLAPYEAMGCNNAGRFGGTDYAELGWLQSHADIDATVRLDAARQGMDVKVAYDQNPLGRFEFEMVALGLDPAVMARTGAMPRIERFNVSFQDRGMLAQRNAYCARKQNEDVTAFVARHVDAVRDDLESAGIFLDASVLAAYQAFAAQGGMLEFLATPNAGFALDEYRHYGLDDQLKMLNANLRHDRGALVPITASFYGQGAGVQAAAPEAGESVRVRVSAAAADDLDPSDLVDLIGERVRLRTVHGVIYVGTLLEMHGGMVRMEVEQRNRSAKQRTAINVEDVVGITLAD